MSSDNIFGKELEGFYSFLAKNNIVQTGIAFLFSLQASIIINSMMKDIVSPILARVLGTNQEKMEDFKLIIFGITFQIGDFILQFINFILILFIIYQLLKLIPRKILGKNI